MHRSYTPHTHVWHAAAMSPLSQSRPAGIRIRLIQACMRMQRMGQAELYTHHSGLAQLCAGCCPGKTFICGLSTYGCCINKHIGESVPNLPIAEEVSVGEP